MLKLLFAKGVHKMTYKRVIIIPYKMGSASAKALKEGLVAEGIRCFRKKVTDIFIPKRTDLIVYYGGVDRLHYQEHCTINANREVAQNKLSAFNAFQDAGLSTVPWTTDKNVALTWDLIVLRSTLTGHSGQGITLHDKNDGGGEFLQDAPLYTQYVKKTYECRVHVFNGKVIDAQVKRKVRDAEAVDTKIRNIHTGWVYCREDFVLDERAKELAVAACAATSLDFGAVDIIYNQHHDKFYLLEVNTAPGLTGTTLINYISEIKKCL